MSEIRVNTFKAEDGISAPSFPNGIQVTGVVTATSLAISVPHLNVGDNIQLGAAGVTTATTFIGALTGNATGLSGTPNITVGSVVASTGTFSGNVSIGGTLTYEDVLNIDSVGIVTAREGIFIPDTKEIKIGNTAASPDIKIYHDGSDSRIHNLTGNFLIRNEAASGNIFLRTKTSESAIDCIPDGAVKLYWNGNPKLETSTSGVTVTGTVAATSYTGDGSQLTNVGFTTEALTTAGATVTIDLSKDEHKITKSGTYTITCTGGSEGSSHTVRIVNSGTSNVGFSTYFLFPSGGTPALPTASGAISLISFSVHRAGAVGVSTQLLAGASVNFSWG